METSEIFIVGNFKVFDTKNRICVERIDNEGRLSLYSHKLHTRVIHFDLATVANATTIYGNAHSERSDSI